MIRFYCCKCGARFNVANKKKYCGKCAKEFEITKKQIDTLETRVQDKTLEEYIRKLKQSIYAYDTMSGKKIEYKSTEVHLTT